MKKLLCCSVTLLTMLSCKSSPQSQVESIVDLVDENLDTRLCSGPNYKGEDFLSIAKKLESRTDNPSWLDRLYWDDDLEKMPEERKQVVASLVSTLDAVPENSKKLFFDTLGGRILVGTNPCEPKDIDYFNVDQLTKKNISCVRLGKDGNGLSFLELRMYSNPELISKNLISQFGFLYSDYFHRLEFDRIESDIRHYRLNMDNSGTEPFRKVLLESFVEDLESNRVVDPKVLKKYQALLQEKDMSHEKLELENTVFARAYESYYCNSWADGNETSKLGHFKNTRTELEKLFPRLHIVMKDYVQTYIEPNSLGLQGYERNLVPNQIERYARPAFNATSNAISSVHAYSNNPMNPGFIRVPVGMAAAAAGTVNGLGGMVLNPVSTVNNFSNRAKEVYQYQQQNSCCPATKTALHMLTPYGAITGDNGSGGRYSPQDRLNTAAAMFTGGAISKISAYRGGQAYSYRPQAPMVNNRMIETFYNSTSQGHGSGRYTQAAYQHNKHFQRMHSQYPDRYTPSTGNPTQRHNAAMQDIQHIVDSPGQWGRTNNGQFYEKYGPTGAGVRMNQDGTFKGYVDIERRNW